MEETVGTGAMDPKGTRLLAKEGERRKETPLLLNPGRNGGYTPPPPSHLAGTKYPSYKMFQALIFKCVYVFFKAVNKEIKIKYFTLQQLPNSCRSL